MQETEKTRKWGKLKFRKCAIAASSVLALSAAIAPASAQSSGYASHVQTAAASSAPAQGNIKLKSLKSPDSKTLTVELSVPEGYHFTVSRGFLVLVGSDGKEVGKLGEAVQLKNGNTAHLTYEVAGATVTVHSSKPFKELGTTPTKLAKQSYSECANGKIKDYVVSGGVGGCIAGAETGCAPGATVGAFGGLVSGAAVALMDC
ncbi:hypothetical protein ACFY12_08935 [Streptomyces sp. NPDC001339]|uniref:hypothetical protein n=1 Tax=Streptomyces sp. NPDC001339 TaxID=3364563 RepID=UPI0036CC24CD